MNSSAAKAVLIPRNLRRGWKAAPFQSKRRSAFFRSL
jgi:hypothetical protein